MVFIKERGSKEGMGKEENKEMEFWTQEEFRDCEKKSVNKILL